MRWMSRGPVVWLYNLAVLPMLVAQEPDVQDHRQATVCTMVVAVASDATDAEHEAAGELASMAGGLCGPGNGSALKIMTPSGAKGKAQLAVGVGAATSLGIPTADLSYEVLGPEGFVASSNRSAALRGSNSYALSGAANSTSGTLYACYYLLRELGVRFLAWDETLLPESLPDPLPTLDRTFIPPFEYRDVDGWAALSSAQQKKYFHMNGAAQAKARVQSVADRAMDPNTTLTGGLSDVAGNGSPYANPPGFVHTSYRLFDGDADGKFNCTGGRCPPLNIFKAHPEWFYPHDDPSVYGQLCWTNQSLIDYIKGQAKKFLSSQPNARIISISQNDNGNYCRDPAEMAIIEAEGSPMGPLLRAVNQVARSIADDFPLVAVDTLAYQYSQPPPNITKPEPNVIIRLCDISSNSGAPLTDPSNALFNSVINGWNAITQRIYIWNYVVDFGEPVMTFPNYYSLGPNIDFFQAHGVRGVFEEGPGMGPGDGTDLEELKDYVMAEKLWDPALDHDVLISEFLSGYYGSAAPFIRLYMDTMHASVDETGYFLHSCCVPPPTGVNKTYLQPIALLTSATAFKQALAAIPPTGPNTATLTGRVERASMAILYVVLWRWHELRAFASNLQYDWPLASSQQAAFDDFARIYNATGTKMLSSAMKGPSALSTFHACVFGNNKACPLIGGGGRAGGALYAEVVLDECSASPKSECEAASSWTAIAADLEGGTIFKSGLSTAKECYAMNVCDVNGECDPVVAYGDATGGCSKAAMQNTFMSVGNSSLHGLLAHPKGFKTSTCTSDEGCCIQQVESTQQSSHGNAAGIATSSTTSSKLVIAPCDPTNVRQQFTVQHAHGTGQIRDKLTGRCLITKHCATPA